MSSEFPQNERENLEAQLTAFLLGELPPDETVALCKAMEQDAELAALYERLKVTIDLVRESAGTAATETASKSVALKLSGERREKLLAQFKTIEPKEFVRPRRLMDSLIPILAVSAMVMLLAALLLPALSRSKSRSQKVTILSNLRLLDGAKQQWALENNKPADARPTLEELKPYLGRDSSALPSIAGETYVPGKVSETPSVDMSVSQARQLLSRGDVAKAEKRDGKVEFSLDDLRGAGVAQRTFGMASSTAPAAAVPAPTPVAAPSAPETQIVLPEGEQAVVATDASGNRFIARYATPGDISGDIKQLADAETNALALDQPNQTWAVTVSGVTNYFDDSFNLQKSYRTLSQLGVDSDKEQVAGTSGKVPLLGDVPMVGSLPTSEPKLAEANDELLTGGLHYFVTNGAVESANFAGGELGLQPAAHGGFAILGPISNGSTEALAGTSHGSKIVLPPAEGQPEGQALAYVDGGTIPARANLEELPQFGAGGGGGGGAELNAGTRRQPVTGGKQVEIAAYTSPTGTFPGGQNRDVQNSGEIAPYLAAKESLENEKHWQQILQMKTGQEEVDRKLPDASLVAIMDPAEASQSEKSGFGEKLRETFTGKVERTARITVEQERPDIAGLGDAKTAIGYDPYFLQTEFETIQSDAVLKKVVENLKLDGGDKSKTQDAERHLKNELDLRAEKNSKMIDIGVRSETPETAARIANSVAQAYRQYRLDEYAQLKDAGIKSLQEQLDEQAQKVAAAQAKVDQLRKDLKISDAMASVASPDALMTASRLRELASLRVQKEADYSQQLVLLQKLKAMDREGLKKALPTAVGDIQLMSLLSELDLAQQNLIKLKTDYAPDHPKYQGAKDLVDDLNRKVDDRVDGIMVGLQSKVDSSKAYLNTLKTNIENAQLTDVETAAPEELKKINAAMSELSAQADTALPKPAVPPPTPKPEMLTRENAFSTFSLNVSDVSFKLAAASLEKGQMPEPASIRSEEFINAFDYRDPQAPPGVPIAFASERARYPFAHNRELLRFSLKTAAAGRQPGRRLNIVLLLDNSGSMERADRVRIIQEALRVLAGQLQAQDTFSIVTFARTAQLRVDGIPGDQAAAAAEEIAKLTPEGGTNLGDALDLAYETALHHYLANGDNRVVMLTDGAANLGDVNPDALKQKVEAHRKQGVALDCFGIGWEGYNDDLLEVLTRNGDGRYGFINTPEEASTEFVSQIAGALHVAASDVKVQVEFNPKRVISYRQIGYAKHQLTKEQFRDNTVDAAEIAAQEAGNALYTIETNPQGEGSIATVRVRYKVPGTTDYREQAWDVPYTGSAVSLEQASSAMRLATTASAFSEWLATSPFAAEVSTDELLKYLNGVPQIYGADTRPAKLEWMIRQAKSISGK